MLRTLNTLVLIAALLACPNLCGQLGCCGEKLPCDDAVHLHAAAVRHCCSHCHHGQGDAGRGHSLPGKSPMHPPHSGCLCKGAVMNAARVMEVLRVDVAPTAWVAVLPTSFAASTSQQSSEQIRDCSFLPADGHDLRLQLCALLI